MPTSEGIVAANEKRELVPTTTRLAQNEQNNSPNYNALLAVPLFSTKDGDVLKFAVSLAGVGSLASPMFALTGRPAMALGLFALPWAYTYYEWRTRVQSQTFALAGDVASKCKLLDVSDCAHCTSIRVRQLKKALQPPPSPAGGSNYPKIDEATLQKVIAEVLPDMQNQGYTEVDGQTKRPNAVLQAVTSDFGVERLVRIPGAWSSKNSAAAGEERLWIGVAEKAPKWVGDEQCVHLCMAQGGGGNSESASATANAMIMPMLTRVAADDLVA